MIDQLVKFIEAQEELPGKFVHMKFSPGGFHICDNLGFFERMQLHYIGIYCQCNCSGWPHEHAIFKCTLEENWKNARKRFVYQMKRDGNHVPEKFDAGFEGNSCHGMNNILYVLGTDSVNYRNGHRIVKRNSHTNHVHPFERLPTASELRRARNILTEKDQEKMEHKQAWWEKQLEQKQKKKDFFAKKDADE